MAQRQALILPRKVVVVATAAAAIAKERKGMAILDAEAVVGGPTVGS